MQESPHNTEEHPGTKYASSNYKRERGVSVSLSIFSQHVFLFVVCSQVYVSSTRTEVAHLTVGQLELSLDSRIVVEFLKFASIYIFLVLVDVALTASVIYRSFRRPFLYLV